MEHNPPDWVKLRRKWFEENRNQAQSSQQKANISEQPVAPNQSANAAAAVVREVALATGATSTADHDTWLLDSGATSHMTPNLDVFASYEEFSEPMPITGPQGAAGTFYAIGRGSITVKTIYNGVVATLTLQNVLHSPDIAVNLISISKLAVDHIQTRFGCAKGKAVLSDARGNFAYADLVGGLYHMRMSICETANLVTTASDRRRSLTLLHRRLGHLSTDRIIDMEKNDTVLGLEIASHDVSGICEPCILGKMTATQAPLRDHRAAAPFEVVHTDIEYMIESSIGGATLALKFIDEHSGYTEVHALKSRSAQDILGPFKLFDAKVETQFGMRIKALHSDNGTEFVNSSMDEYLAQRGILHRTIVPYRHEMNGIAERANRTGSDAVRAMLFDASLPPSLWPYAYRHWALIRNITSNSFIDPSKTPYEIVHGKKPDISHLRVFGCSAYSRVPPELRSKLEPKALKGRLVGIVDNAYYQIWTPGTHEIYRSRDVIFDEGSTGPRVPLGAAAAPSNSDNSNVNPSVTPEPAAPPVPGIPADPPTALRRSLRGDHTTERRAEGLRQESELAHLDQPEAAHAASTRRYVDGKLIPRTWKEAMSTPEAAEWKTAAAYEGAKLDQHQVGTLVPRPIDAHILDGMCVFNIKKEADGALVYRVRYVVRGDHQVEGEYGELFAVSGDFILARFSAAFAIMRGGKILAIDISSAFLHSRFAPNSPRLYCAVPPWLAEQFPGMVWVLDRVLYGLKQGPNAWQDHLGEKMASGGYRRLVSAPSAFHRSGPEGEIFIATHVDDCQACCITTPGAVDQAARFLSDIGVNFKYSQKDLTKAAIILGMRIQVDYDEGWVKFDVGPKIERMLDKYGMSDAIPVGTPMVVNALKLFAADDSEGYDSPPFPYAALIGELMWIASACRPDISFAVQVLARFTAKPKDIHWLHAERVLRYLKRFPLLGPRFRRSAMDSFDAPPYALSDSDWGRNPDGMKSTSGHCVIFAGSVLLWRVRTQRVVALSSAEAEYYAVSKCACDAIWVRHFFEEMGRSFGDRPFVIRVDNQAAIAMAANPVYRSRTKHIDLPVHHIRDEVKQGRITLQHIDGNANAADIFTKPLPEPAHARCVELIGLL